MQVVVTAQALDLLDHLEAIVNGRTRGKTKLHSSWPFENTGIEGCSCSLLKVLLLHCLQYLVLETTRET